MPLLLQSLTFGVAVFFILLGIVGIIIPILPGSFLVWLTVFLYALLERGNGFAAIDPLSFAVITLLALVTGLADLWLPVLGARASGSSKRSVLLGFLGSLIGTFIFPLVGTILGYAAGVLLGEYHKRGDWDLAVRAAVGGITSWGIATLLQLGGAVLILIIFVWQVLAYSPPA